MAKVISDEILKLKIIINGDEAQKRVLDLERANNTLANRINDLKNKEKELSRQRSKDPEQIAKIKKEISTLTNAMAENNRKIDEEVKAMNILSLTSDQLKKRIKDLAFTMEHMNPNSTAYRQAKEEMDALNSRMKVLRTGTSSASSTLQKLSDKFNQYSGIATAAIAALAGVAFSIQNVIDANNKMADAQTAVVKTTGLAIEQVKELTRAFSEFDTRTSKIDLLKIAEIGGRLGVPKEEIKDFTREIDKAYVALGDAFSGGVEAVAEKLGKIKGLFKETRDESIADAVNEIGSALNELGAAGAASEENMSDFALRIGQLPEALKPTIAETIALGGAFEESGITAERASSGYSKFVRVAAVEAAGFAQVMGLTEKEVKKLINQDPLQFFLKFAQGARGLEATKLSEILDGLKLNDAETIATIGAASENTDRFRRSIELSNQALTEATSLQTEFDKVNNNSAAIYEKVQKKFASMFTSETVAKTLNWLIETFGKLIGVTVEGEEKTGGFNNALLFLIRTIGLVVLGFTSVSVAMALYNTLIKESVIKNIALEAIEKGRELRLKMMASFQALYNLSLAAGASLTARIASAIGLQTIATNAQEIAQKRLNATTAANPLMALLTVLTLVIAAYVAWKSHIDEVRAAEKKQFEEAHKYQTQQLEIMQKGKQDVQEYKNGIANLIAVIRDENATQEMRKKAYEELIKLHPEFMGTVDKEYRETKKLAQVYEELAKQIDLTARMRARSAAKQSVYDENAKLELEYMKGALAREKEQEERNKLRKQYNYSSERANSAVNMFGSFEEHNRGIEILNQIQKNSALINQYNEADKKRIKQLQELIKTAEGAQKKLYEQELYALLGMSEQSDPAKSNYKPLPEKEKKKPKTDEEKAAEKALREYERNRDKILEGEASYLQKLQEMREDAERNRISMMKDGYEKEKALILLNQNDKISDLENKKVSDDDMAKIDAMIAKETGGIKKRLEAIRHTWKQENDALTTLQLQEKQVAELKLLALTEKYLAITKQKEEEAFQASLKTIDRDKNISISKYRTLKSARQFLIDVGYTENLDKIKSFSEAQAEIEKYYQEKSLQQQLDYLNKKVGEFDAMLINRDFTIPLDPEQLKTIEEYRNKIAELVKEITALKSGGNAADEKLGGKLKGLGGQSDLLGLTTDQWDAMFTKTGNLVENLQKVSAAIVVMKNMMQMYSDYTSANEARLLQQYETSSQRKQTRLDKELKAGMINQEQYKKATLKNEKDLERKKAELEYKRAKRERTMQIANTIANTAMGIMQAYSQLGPIAGTVAAVLVGAVGAFQLATIMSQPLPEVPGAEDGFYPVLRKQDNRLFRARRREQRTGVYSEPTMLVGEQGAGYPELVVTSKTARQIDPDISNAYMREIARIEGFEEGYYKNVKNTSGSNSSSSSDEMMIKLINSIDSFNETMRVIKDEGFDARIADSFDNGKKLDKMTKDYQNLYNNSKH
ncbi:phage tail tape measure protein [Epilithonimonas pallida]|uniref:Tubulin-specific chaperone A n=1 Tax=Epilithonimonas pallida TaxID=373671 RepID=A0ABY1R6I8_9FLAO|nr:phage tail tape measure protein [Epilithonimonas pallida]SMP94722.1 tubulin-specific chaperone A [Epilithonimonas pallida]